MGWTASVLMRRIVGKRIREGPNYSKVIQAEHRRQIPRKLAANPSPSILSN